MMLSSDDLAGVFQQMPAGIRFNLTVLPRSSKCGITGVQEGCLKVKLTKPPVDGQANTECCRFFAKLFGIPKSQVSIIRGETSRHKMLQAEGLTADEACRHIAACLNE